MPRNHALTPVLSSGIASTTLERRRCGRPSAAAANDCLLLPPWELLTLPLQELVRLAARPAKQLGSLTPSASFSAIAGMRTLACCPITSSTGVRAMQAWGACIAASPASRCCALRDESRRRSASTMTAVTGTTWAVGGRARQRLHDISIGYQYRARPAASGGLRKRPASKGNGRQWLELCVRTRQARVIETAARGGGAHQDCHPSPHSRQAWQGAAAFGGISKRVNDGQRSGQQSRAQPLVVSQQRGAHEHHAAFRGMGDRQLGQEVRREVQVAEDAAPAQAAVLRVQTGRAVYGTGCRPGAATASVVVARRHLLQVASAQV